MIVAKWQRNLRKKRQQCNIIAGLSLFNANNVVIVSNISVPYLKIEIYLLKKKINLIPLG